MLTCHAADFGWHGKLIAYLELHMVQLPDVTIMTPADAD